MESRKSKKSLPIKGRLLLTAGIIMITVGADIIRPFFYHRTTVGNGLDRSEKTAELKNLLGGGGVTPIRIKA